MIDAHGERPFSRPREVTNPAGIRDLSAEAHAIPAESGSAVRGIRIPAKATAVFPRPLCERESRHDLKIVHFSYGSLYHQ